MSTITGKEQFTHPRIMSAYKSLLTNLPYLFTYKSEKEIVIHNTTNSLDGGAFSPMKKLIIMLKEFYNIYLQKRMVI